LLAFNLRRADYLIKYCPDAIVHHGARDSFANFMKWHFKRGISSYIFSTKVSGKKDFLLLRAWSMANILRHYYRDKKIPVIVMLLCTSILLQFAGYIYGRYQGEFLCES
jgi:GT2 family glycosyltransferase